MKYQIKFLLIFMILLGFFSACQLIRTLPKQLDCPVPQQDCSSQRWTGIPFDTSEITSKVLGYYYVVTSVKQINSPSDEWSLSFIDSKRAAFMFTDFDQQRMMVARMVRPDKFTIESGFYVPVEGHNGPLSHAGKFAVFSAIKEKPYDYKPDIVKVLSADQLRQIQDLSSSRFEEAYKIKSLKPGDTLNLFAMPYDYVPGNAKLYSANLENTSLNSAEPLLPDNSDAFSWDSHPAVTPDGNAVFFASDREDGLGGTDLWFTVKLPNGKWSKPINAGDSINSKCDELTPFITKDGKRMFFSSAGHQTVGGYDIFSIEISEQFYKDIKASDIDIISAKKNYFSKLRNLRPPLNTSYDELFPSSPGDADSILYYSSNQAAQGASLIQMKGGFDLYVRYKEKSPYVIAEAKKRTGDVNIDLEGKPDLSQDIKSPELKIPPKVEPKIEPTYTLEGKVINADTKKPVPDAEVIVRESPSNQITKQTVTDQVGKYQVELEKDKEFEITAQAKDLFFDSFKLRVDSDDPTRKIEKDFQLPETFILRVNFPLDNFTDPYRYVMDSLGVETNRLWQSEIDRLAENILKAKDRLQKVILVGHTDYIGSEEYNIKLGQRRVDFVMGELIKRGVPVELLEGRSAGESEPLPKFKGEDENLYRKRLRRVTLEKILNQ